MKPALSKIALAALVAAPSLLVACSSEDGPERSCELEVSSDPIEFGMLCLGAEAESSFNLENPGELACEVTLALAGDAPQHFGLPTSVVVPAGGSVPVKVKYHPTAAGGAAGAEQHGALVTITDATKPDAKEPATFEVELRGETADAENKAILSLSCANKCPTGGVSTEACCNVTDETGNNAAPVYGRSYVRSVQFGEVQINRTRTLPLQVTNLGCGVLEVSELKFTATTGEGYCGETSVRVVTPFDNPLSVPGSFSAEGRQSATIELEFAPTEVCNYVAKVVVSTNDPDIEKAPEYGTFNAMGNGSQGRIEALPSALGFGDIAVGATDTKVISLYNVSKKDADIELSLRDGEGVYKIVKVEQPECPVGSTPTTLDTKFTLDANDGDSECGKDQANVTISFTPNAAGLAKNSLEVAYDDGSASVALTGRSDPKVEVYPGEQLLFYGPKRLGCEPLSCVSGTSPNATCAGVCSSDGDCDDEALCVGGVCARESLPIGFDEKADYAVCAETCGQAERVVRVCNTGHAPLKIDDPSDDPSPSPRGGVVLTGPGGVNDPVPTHVKMPGLDDPERDGKDVFSIVSNGCVDASGNGVTLAALKAGEEPSCCDVTVGFLDVRTGGDSGYSARLNARLRVYTNDPDRTRNLTDGAGPDIEGRTDTDLEPVAKFVHYGAEGPTDTPKIGRMVVLDAGPVAEFESKGSFDRICESTETEECRKPVVSYEWELVSISGVQTNYVTAMRGANGEYAKIDLDQPNKNCGTFNDGRCFEVLERENAPKGQAIMFYADGVERDYEFKLTVKDDVCTVPHQAVYQYEVRVGR